MRRLAGRCCCCFPKVKERIVVIFRGLGIGRQAERFARHRGFDDSRGRNLEAIVHFTVVIPQGALGRPFPVRIGRRNTRGRRSQRLARDNIMMQPFFHGTMAATTDFVKGFAVDTALRRTRRADCWSRIQRSISGWRRGRGRGYSGGSRVLSLQVFLLIKGNDTSRIVVVVHQRNVRSRSRRRGNAVGRSRSRRIALLQSRRRSKGPLVGA